MKAIVRFMVTVICVVVTAYLLPGIGVRDFTAAIVVAAILGLLNMFLKPILVITTIPVTVFTLGLFLLIINGFIVWVTGKLVPGYFRVDSFLWAMLFSVVLAVVNSLTEKMLGLNREEE